MTIKSKRPGRSLAPRQRLRSLAVLTGLLGALAAGGAARPARIAAAPDDSAALVRRLGDAEYRVREEAAALLASQGLKAQPAVMAGLHAEDPEVRRRCRRILVRVLQADYERRIAALLADREGGDHDLPGWTWYRQAIGSDRNAREFFAAILRAEPGLLASAEQGPEPAEEAFQLRFAQLHQQARFPNPSFRRQPGMESVAALLLVAVHPQWRLPGPLVDNPQLLNFMRGGDFGRALSESEYRAAMRRLTGQWILIQGARRIAQQKLRMAIQFQIPEGLAPAVEMLEQSEGQSPNMAAFAAEAVARLGGKSYAALLLPLLDDERQCARTGQRVIEVRDVALAWLVHLTGQNLEAYGQATARNWFQSIAQNPAMMFNFSQFGYADGEGRAEALEKWSEWLEANPLPTPPDAREALVADRPAGQPEGVPLPAEPRPAAAGGLDMADRVLVRRLQEADQLAEMGEYPAAAQLLGLLLAAESDSVFRPDRRLPVYRHLKPAAEEALGQLPDEGRAAYQLLFGAEARHLLQEAVAAGDRQQMVRVAQYYFHTEAGAEAAYLLGAGYWRAGQFFTAAAYWRRLAQSGGRAAQFEPALSLQLAACWWAMGEPQRIPQRLQQLRAQYAGAPLEVAGRQKPWFDDAADARPWLAALLGHKPAPSEARWGMFRGRPSRNPVAEGGSPYLAADPLDAPEKSPPLRKAIDRVRHDYLGRRRAALPTLNPLIVDETIVVRTATRIRAVDAESGDLLWEALPEDPLSDLLNAPDGENDESIDELLPTDLLNRLWQNLAYGVLSSDGRLVFAVEGLPLHGSIGPQRMVVGRDGVRGLDLGALGKDNLLAAYDLASGKLRWEAGGPAGQEDRELAGAYFLGPPLPLGANLYAIAEIGDQTVLLVLDAATGALQWQRVLAVHDEPDPRQAMNRIPGVAMPRVPEPPRADGASPSYADGILVCPIRDEQVAAVDLTTRSVIWLYEGQDDLSDETLAQRRLRAARARSQQQRSHPPTDQWADSCATAVKGHVLLTPPGSDQLVCLRLADGMERWTAPRGDGLYVGAVHEGVVVVVGRSGVRGLRLADGEPAWDEELPLPPGALPSGRGFLSGERFYIPLNTAEVVGIDVLAGRVVSRSRSPAGIVPGNLVGVGSGVVSQSVDGVWRFDLIADRERLAARRIAEDPDDAAAWAERGELLLCDGRIAEAVECLVRARRLAPTEQSRQRLARAVTDGLWTDYDRFRPLAEDLELEEMDAGQRASVLRAMGWGAQRAGDRATALDTYLELARIDPAADVLQPLSAAVRVRRDRWLAARIEELLDGADDEEYARVRPRLASLSDEARVRYLPLQPDSAAAWLRTGVELAEGGNRRTAELRWRGALGAARPDAAPEAVARLAGLLRRQGRAAEAARLYARLAGPLADTVCLGARTGRELVEALEAGDPAHPRHIATPLWPPGELKAAAEDRDGRQTIVYHAPVLMRPADPQFDRPANIRVENVGRTLYGFDNLGRQQWELPLSDAQARINFRNGHYLAQGTQLGQIAVVWLLSRVCAIDLSGGTPQLLWEHRTTDLGGNDPRHRQRIQLAHRRAAQQRRGGPSEPGASPLVVAHGYACFERNDELVAVDLESGEILWARDDVAENIKLFGDSRYVFVVPASGNADARVFSALDGRELGRRSLPPPSARLATAGRRILAWEESPQRCRIRLIDPWDAATVWEREMPAGSHVALVRPDAVAVLDPEGRFAVLRTDSGEPMLETRLDAQPELESLYVEPYGENYLIVANRPAEPVERRVHARTPIPSIDVHGGLYCVGPNGELLWEAEVRDQRLELDLPSELPVLLLSKRRQHRVPRDGGGVRTRVEYAILCLDKRTGRTLYDETFATHGQEVEIRAADPKGGLIEVITRPMSLRITRVK